MIDKLQSDIVHLLFLFYTSVGVIQRDASAAALDRDRGIETEQTLRMENNISELIGSLVTTKKRICEALQDLEGFLRDAEDNGAITRLLEESQALDTQLREKMEETERELPLLKSFLEKRLKSPNP